MLSKETVKTVVVKSWSSVREHTVQEHVIYNILRGKPIDQGFTPITNPSKITSNGNDPQYALFCSCLDIRLMLDAKRWNYDPKKIEHLGKVFGIEMNEELVKYILEKVN